MIDLDNLDLMQIIPPNLQSDPTVQAAAQAINSEIQKLNQQIQELDFFSRLDTIDEKEADELAWEFHVDFYDPTLPLETKRDLVKKSYAWHRRKGTPSAVEELIATVFGSGTVQEWFEYGGQPYHFKVLTNDPAATNESAARFLRAVNSVKNTRSFLESVEITTEADMDLFFGGIVHIGDYMKLEQGV